MGKIKITLGPKATNFTDPKTSTSLTPGKVLEIDESVINSSKFFLAALQNGHVIKTDKDVTTEEKIKVDETDDDKEPTLEEMKEFLRNHPEVTEKKKKKLDEMDDEEIKSLYAKKSESAE